MDNHSISIVLISLFLSAIFSGIEVAFLASDKFMLELDKQQNVFFSKILTFILNKPSYILGTTLICTTIGLVLSSSYLTIILEEVINPILPSQLKNDLLLMFINTLIITTITLLFAEFIPKSIFILSPNKFLYFFSLPLIIATFIFYPIVSIMLFISNFFLKYIFNHNYKEDKKFFELKDFHSFLQKNIDYSTTNPTLLRAKMITNLIDFKKLRIRDCIVPRTEVIAINDNEDIDILKKAFIENEHSRVLIYKENIDNIIGYCHLKEILKKPKTISSILRPITIIPETSFAWEIMINFIEKNENIALVTDEYGGTAGIVTLEDIIEEIFGEIQDEHDTENLLTKKISNNTFIFSARNEIDFLNEKFHLDLPTGNYETLGGLITNFLGKVPHKKELIEIKNYKFEILSTKKNYINDVKMTVIHDLKIK